MEEKMRRSDRQLTDYEARSILHTGEYGVLSTCSAKGIPYGTPVNYVYNDEVLYFHCAKNAGKKVKNLKECQHVSFTAVGVTCLLPAQFGTLYESVIVEGTAREVDDSERKLALDLMIEKYSAQFKESGQDHIQGAWDRVAVYAIDPSNITAKGRKH